MLVAAADALLTCRLLSTQCCRHRQVKQVGLCNSGDTLGLKSLAIKLDQLRSHAPIFAASYSPPDCAENILYMDLDAKFDPLRLIQVEHHIMGLNRL